MTDVTPLNSAWLMQNINTNTIPGIQLSEAKAALQATNEAVKEFLANFNNVADGVDPTIDTEQLAKLLIEASLTQSIHINTPGGLVAVLDGSVIPDIAPKDAPPAVDSRRSIVTPGTGEEAKASPPSEEPDAETFSVPIGAVRSDAIKDGNGPFKIINPGTEKKPQPATVVFQATRGLSAKSVAKAYATTTTKEGKALLGISGRMDAADRAILVKQHFARKALARAEGGNTEKSRETNGKTEGTVKKAARTVTNAASAPVRWLMKGAGAVAGLFSKGAKTKMAGWADGLKWEPKASTSAPGTTEPTGPESQISTPPAEENVDEATAVADTSATAEIAPIEVVEAEDVDPTPESPTITKKTFDPPKEPEIEPAPASEPAPAPSPISIQPEDDVLPPPLLTEKEPEISIQGDPEKIREALEKNIENQERIIQSLQDAIEAEKDASKRSGMENSLKPLIAQLERSKTLLETLNKKNPEVPKEPTSSE